MHSGFARKLVVYGHLWSGFIKQSHFNRLVSESFCPGFCIAKMSLELKSLLLLCGVFGIGEMPYILAEMSNLWLAFAAMPTTFCRSS